MYQKDETKWGTRGLRRQLKFSTFDLITVAPWSTMFIAELNSSSEIRNTLVKDRNPKSHSRVIVNTDRQGMIKFFKIYSTQFYILKLELVILRDVPDRFNKCKKRCN